MRGVRAEPVQSQKSLRGDVWVLGQVGVTFQDNEAYSEALQFLGYFCLGSTEIYVSQTFLCPDAAFWNSLISPKKVFCQHSAWPMATNKTSHLGRCLCFVKY